MVEVTAPQFHQVVKESGATLAVVNLWATWCPPCIEEFPYFMKLGKDLADHGVKVFFVSMDVAADRPAIQAFLAKQGYSGTSYLRAGTDHAFITALHETWTGVLPATLLYSQNGSLADFWVGKPVNYKALKKRVLKALHP